MRHQRISKLIIFLSYVQKGAFLLLVWDCAKQTGVLGDANFCAKVAALLYSSVLGMRTVRKMCAS